MLVIKYGDSISAMVDALQYQNEHMIFVNTKDIETIRKSDGSMTIWGDNTWLDTGTEKYHPLYNAEMWIPKGTVFFTEKCYPALYKIIDDKGNDVNRIDNGMKCGVKVHLSSKETGEFLIYWVNPIDNKSLLATKFDTITTVDLSTIGLINLITTYYAILNQREFKENN